MKAIFGQIPDKKKIDLSPDDSDASDEPLESYKAPLNDLYPRSSTPGAEGNERGMYDPTERNLRAFYDPDSDDEFFTDKQIELNRQLPTNTPKGQGTLRSNRAQNILRNDREDPEMSAEEFARLVDDPQYADLVARQRKKKKPKSPYNAPPYEIKTPCRKKLQLRL